MKSKKQNKEQKNFPEGFDCWDRSDPEFIWMHKKLSNRKFRHKFIVDSLNEGLDRCFVKDMLQFFGFYM
jgi:hypothetical protein